MLTDADRNLIFAWINDVDAYAFFVDVCKAFEFWDDLIDKDKELTTKHINNTMFSLMISIPNNSFYIQHRTNLTPVLAAIINAWAYLIPALEKNHPTAVNTVYVVRRCVTSNADLLLHIIMLLHGVKYVEAIADDLAVFFTAKEELFSEYVDGLPVQRS